MNTNAQPTNPCHMKTAHQVIRDFKREHNISAEEEKDYMQQNEVPEEERNIYDSRYLEHLNSLVAGRHADLRVGDTIYVLRVNENISKPDDFHPIINQTEITAADAERVQIYGEVWIFRRTGASLWRKNSPSYSIHMTPEDAEDAQIRIQEIIDAEDKVFKIQEAVESLGDLIKNDVVAKYNNLLSSALTTARPGVDQDGFLKKLKEIVAALSSAQDAIKS